MSECARFWNHLLACSEAIASIDCQGGEALSSLQAHMDTLVECYGKEFDPAEEFEAYVAFALCQSIARILFQAGKPGRVG